ncbi:MAG: glycerophosphodiester phosphodiesterase family protein [Rhodospirillales bacterium]
MAGAAPVVIGHRGACGLRPEHTLESYALAIAQGADFIEPDLVATRDGILVARHENEIAGTTDVAHHPEFADRRTTKAIDGVAVAGWFTEDFALAELKTLRAVERIPDLRPGNAAFDGRFAVPTLQEVIDLASAESARIGRPIGIYPETKHPAHFRAIGLALEAPLAAALNAADALPAFVQSFDPDSLRTLAGLTAAPLVQLLDRMPMPGHLRAVAGYAAAVGPHKDLIVPRDAADRLAEPTRLVADAHDAGLLVHAWTFRSENRFLPADFRRGDPAEPRYLRRHGDAGAEYARFYALGVDGVFSDFPAAAVAARRAFSPAAPSPSRRRAISPRGR